MGNNNTKPENSDISPSNSQNHPLNPDPKTVVKTPMIPSDSVKSASKPDYEIKTSILINSRPQEPKYVPEQSFKPKKFDKDRFKLANQPYKSTESVSSALISTALLDDDDEKLMNSILNTV